MDYYNILKTVLSKYKPEEIAKYLRLSLEDNSKKGGLVDESESIANQRRIVNHYLLKVDSYTSYILVQNMSMEHF